MFSTWDILHVLIFAYFALVLFKSKPEKTITAFSRLTTIKVLPFLITGAVGFPVGLYSWDHSVWRDPDSRFISFLESSKGSDFIEGDIYVNIADHVFPRDIPDLHRLLEFMQRIRSLGNRQIIYVTYGDKNGADSGAFAEPSFFVDAFFDWVTSLTPETVQSIVPLGISFDCERFPAEVVRDTLLYAQAVKLRYLDSHFGSKRESLSIQWVVEGKLNPRVTDAVMRFADSALMMVYRNYLFFSPSDPAGYSGLSTRLRDYFLTQQCAGCMQDEFATANYHAKISIMVEASCEVDDICPLVSFCAKHTESDFITSGSPASSNPVEYLVSTLQGLERIIFSDREFTPDQRNRLFADRKSLFVIHNFEWFSCYFGDSDIAFKPALCAKYARAATECRGDGTPIIHHFSE